MMEELTQEQLEIAKREEARREQEVQQMIKQSIQAGKDLEKLKKSPAWKRLVEGLFLQQGLDILWQNLRHLKEEQMKGRGNDRNLEVIEMIEGQVKSRLDFQGFLDTVENDYENALEELEAQEKEANERSVA